VNAPPSLSLNGGVEGLDATGVLPPLLGPGMLTDAEGYSAWEREAVGVFNDRRYTAENALTIISVATDAVCRWRPGAETLEARVHAAFDRARGARDLSSASDRPSEHAIKSFLAAHLFASWHPYQDGGLQAAVRAVETAFVTLREELASRLRPGRAPFIAAVRAADFRLRHSRTDVCPRSLPSLRRH
jgi:hypothetical protein